MNDTTCNNKQNKQLIGNIKLWLSGLIILCLLATPLQLIAATRNSGKANQKVNTSSSRNNINAVNAQLAGDLLVARHAPGLNGGRVEGAIRILQGESFNINSNTVVTGDIYIPGTPQINVNANVTYRGIIQGTGNPQPATTINLNSNSTLNHIVSRTDPIQISSVPTVAPGQGNRDISLNKNDQPGDFSTIRNLTLNSSYGNNLAIPPGSYGNFTANSNTGFILGINHQATSYSLQNLNLNSNSQILVQGTVTLNIQNGINLNSNVKMGNSSSPISLAVNIANGGINLNSNSQLYAIVRTPTGTVNINANSLLVGLLVCDRVNINSGGTIKPLVTDTTPPQITIVQPTDNQIITTATTTVTGTLQDDSLITSVKVGNNITATITGNNFTASNVPLTIGSNTLTVTATDVFNNVGSAQVTVMRSDGNNQAPVVNAGADQTINLPSSVNLVGTVTDDGKPNPPTILTYTWSKVSGSGTVTFSSPSSLTTSATFSTTGTYTLKLKVSDSQLTGEDTIVITVNSQQNQAPVVNAGVDQIITLPSTATLVGVVTDDGLPNPPAQTTVSWSKVSGSGTVTFSNQTSVNTTTTFSTAGTYVLRLTANDSVLTATDDIQVIVNPQPAQNTAPTVSAGQNQTITLPSTASLNGTVTDDGLPNPPGQLTISWTKVNGPGTVTFTNGGNTAQTQATFSIAGTYTLRLSASDSSLASSSDITITVNPAIVNQPPIVSAGQNQTVLIPGLITLQGSVSDDGLPNNTLTQIWSKVSGSGDVVFSMPTQVTTNVTFSTDGVYVLRLTASDGILSTSADVQITVRKEPFLLLYSTASGFDPEQLTLSATPLFLSVINRTGLDGVTYNITNTTNQQVVATFTLQQGQETFVELQTSAGNNLLIIVVDHPTWQCQITVVP
jgi:hypothetical protein